MNVKTLLAALAVGSAMVVSNVAFAADKEAKPAAAKSEGKTAEAKSADAKADEKVGDAKPAASGGGSAAKLTKPWSDIPSLTDDQKDKIAALHKKALAEVNAIEKREKDEIMAVLTDAQRAEMKDAADKKKKEAAAKRAAEKKADAK